jgi:unconventional prefoldin RPB5 interactor 1
MAQKVKDSFLDLERHRQLLEENIEKLRKLLRHWQTWEAEYEGLKEEILAADPAPDHQQLVELAHEYEGDLVNRKEVDELLGAERRDAAQVVNLLDKRLDYVEQNVKTIQRQLEAAENKLAAATIISTPDVRNEEGLPVTEIMEELDEDGNVISSSLSTPGSAKPQLLEVLRKAGVKDLPSITGFESQTPAANKSEPKEMAKPTKKGVKFTEDTKPGPEVEKSQTAKRIEEIMSIAKQSEATLSEPPIIPTDESPEDAALRREMLQYRSADLSEVGAVVAELELEEGSDWSDEDYDDATSTDDEDQFGRSTNSVVDDELRQRMIELEGRLGARMMKNIGKKASDFEPLKEGIGRITINDHESGVTAAPGLTKQQSADVSFPTTDSSKKSVRFSEDLDISTAPTHSIAALTTAPKSNPAPITDVVERTAPGESAASTPKKKTSRFKSDRASTANILNGPLDPKLTKISGPSLSLFPAVSQAPKPFSQPIHFPVDIQRPIAPTGPPGKTISSTIIESNPASAPSEPDELDSNLLHQEVATDYNRMRNRMIQRQGGFMKEEESEVVPFTEDEGGPKKMSRFKAARLARS